MDQHVYPETTKELAQKRRALAPEIHSAFRAFGQRVFADGALPEKTKQLIAVAVAHVTQCPYCIRGHTDSPHKKARPSRSSWKPFGSPPRCVPGQRTHIR